MVRLRSEHYLYPCVWSPTTQFYAMDRKFTSPHQRCGMRCTHLNASMEDNTVEEASILRRPELAITSMVGSRLREIYRFEDFNVFNLSGLSSLTMELVLASLWSRGTWSWTSRRDASSSFRFLLFALICQLHCCSKITSPHVFIQGNKFAKKKRRGGKNEGKRTGKGWGSCSSLLPPASLSERSPGCHGEAGVRTNPLSGTL